MKVPCVAADVGAIDEIIDDKTGLLFSAGDLETLVSHIRALLQDRPRREQMGEAGCNKVAAQFTSTQMAEKHLQFYQKVLNYSEETIVAAEVAD